jgi:arginase family enzyme
MLLVIRSRFPHVANVLSFISGVTFLAIGILAGASPTVLILGGGSSVVLSAVRYFGKRHPQLVAGRGTVSAP